MVYRIEKEFTFSAAHQLTGLPEDHPCSRLHGHNYAVKLVLAGELSKVGFVRDYRDLDKFKDYLDRDFDHQYLGAAELDIENSNSVTVMVPRALFGWNPTAENMSCYFFQKVKEWFPELAAVGVSETPKTWAWYEEW